LGKNSRANLAAASINHNGILWKATLETIKQVAKEEDEAEKRVPTITLESGRPRKNRAARRLLDSL
jgi:hypothetical protein